MACLRNCRLHALFARFLDQVPERVRAERELGDLDTEGAQGVADGVAQRAGDVRRPALADAAAAEWVCGQGVGAWVTLMSGTSAAVASL